MARYGGKPIEKFVKGMPSLDVIEQCPHRDARSRKARDAAHALRIYPDHLIEADSWWAHEWISTPELTTSRDRPVATRVGKYLSGRR
jgi:hypothetical protein